ncbi:hypothetical protein AYO21_10241 [Fonsecaea monophora]|uniref:Uncharacterized protein n=1 Tax=Fonsecaea monophora TaxID=254056 RepID=A0A177EU55_9EURO|nr:hypothetical protein AYO21_10241 [Fonsecaea monophora]OAG35565.1 hypothetical protein AYO21_10241 [Fonsecaea monophora]
MSSHNHHHNHPDHHAHSSHQHGPTHDSSVHSPHRHNPSATYTSSSDPSTAPHAPSTHKILGDIKGAVHGVTGSLQAATGTVLGQKHMADKGFAKMGEEDARLAAKTGKPPVQVQVQAPPPPSMGGVSLTTEPEQVTSHQSTGTGKPWNVERGIELASYQSGSES